MNRARTSKGKGVKRSLTTKKTSNKKTPRPDAQTIPVFLLPVGYSRDGVECQSLDEFEVKGLCQGADTASGI